VAVDFSVAGVRVVVVVVGVKRMNGPKMTPYDKEIFESEIRAMLCDHVTDLSESESESRDKTEVD